MAKTAVILFLAVILTACTGFLSTPTITSTEVMETALAIIKTEIVGTLTAMPANTPVPSASPLPPTETSIPVPQSSSIPISGTPTIVNMENGLTWTECVQPNLDYANSAPDMEFVTPCLNMERPYWNDNDNKIAGERISGNNGSDLRQVIGNDVFLAKHDSTNGCCDYEFLKNGNVIMEISAPLITFDPNRNL